MRKWMNKTMHGRRWRGGVANAHAENEIETVFHGGWLVGKTKKKKRKQYDEFTYFVPGRIGFEWCACDDFRHARRSSVNQCNRPNQRRRWPEILIIDFRRKPAVGPRRGRKLWLFCDVNNIVRAIVEMSPYKFQQTVWTAISNDGNIFLLSEHPHK